MDAYVWILLAVGLTVLSVIGLGWAPLQTAWRRGRFAEARRSFHCQRERLEAKFVQIGSMHSRPHAPRWVDCDFADDVAYARNRSTGELSAFVGVTITIEDFTNGFSLLETDIGAERTGTAVFRFDGRCWQTDGRAIFNLSPTEAIHFYQRDLEMVAQELAGRP